LDAMDVAGDNQLNVEHEMVKQRVSRHGVPIGAAGVEIIGEVRKIIELLFKYTELSTAFLNHNKLVLSVFYA